MKKLTPIIISFFLTAGCVLVQAQVNVFNFNELPVHLKQFVLPDVDGKVLIDESALKNNEPLNFRADTIFPFPGWPVRIAGTSQRGGIACNLDSDNDLEIIFNIGNKVYALNHDGSDVPGWPKGVASTPAEGAPAFGDIDGDGIGDIVVTTRVPGTANDGKIYAFNWDGTNKPGFPVTCSGGPVRTPVLADIDGDGILEIVIEEREYPTGYVNVYKGDGTILPGWPQEMDYIPASAVAVGDITGDGIPEIVAESYYSVYAYDKNGNLVDGFPFTPGNNRVFSYSSPVLADIDADGLREIIVGDHSLIAGNGQVHVLRNNGQPIAGFPKTVSYWLYAPASVANFDGIGGLDIIIGDQVLSGVPSNKLYAWSSNGSPLAGFPVPSLNAINSQALIADIDGDFMYEAIIDDNTGAGVYRAFNSDGTELTESGWPLGVIGSTFFMNPLITDLNFDGKLDMVGGGSEISTNFTNLYEWNLDMAFAPYSIVLPVLQYNIQHTGVYGQIDTLYVNIDDQQWEKNKSDNLRVFPSVVTDNLTVIVGGESPSVEMIQIYDQCGRLVFSKPVHEEKKMLQFSIEASFLKPGLYYLRIISQSDIFETGKFIKIN